MNITTTPKFEIILTIGINFLSDFIPMFSFMAYMITEEDSFLFATVSFMIICLRIFVLPIYYRWLERRTENEMIKIFVKNLKHNSKIKVIMLFPVSLIFTYISFCFIAQEISFIFIDVKGLSIVSTLFGSAGNYLFLFFYWYVIDLYKKYKQKN